MSDLTRIRWTALLIGYLSITLSPTNVYAADSDPPVLQMGIGTLSCATWLATPNNRNRGEQWAFGFLTGMNAMSSMHDDVSTVGKGTDQPGFAASIKKTCDEDPSKLLVRATVEVYWRLKGDGR